MNCFRNNVQKIGPPEVEYIIITQTGIVFRTVSVLFLIECVQNYKSIYNCR